MRYTDEQLATAFPAHKIQFPPLGVGGFKAAYKTEVGGEPGVLKVGLDPVASALIRAEGATIPDRLAREAEILRSKSSPHLVRVTAGPSLANIAGKQHVWFQEVLLDGGSLQERLEMNPLGRDEALAVAHALTAAVEALWEGEQVVHRDIKPANVLFDADGGPVLIDLGSALAGQMSDLTTPGNVAPTTYPYSPPELLTPRIRDDATIDFRADLFSVGIVLAESCLGAHPVWRFGDTPWSYLERLETVDADFLITCGLEPAIAVVVARAISIHPARRYNSIQRFREALDGLR